VLKRKRYIPWIAISSQRGLISKAEVVCETE
jgi:hypothetical protein